MNIFGFAHTNFNLVLSRCKRVAGKASVQVLTNRDQVSRRKCFVALGVKTLDAARVSALNQCSGVLVVVDALPVLRRIEGITILDAAPTDVPWRRQPARFSKLDRALSAPARELRVSLRPDDTLARMIAEVRERSILDKVLAAARTMEPSDRAALHLDVAFVLSGKIKMSAFRRRAESRGAKGRAYEKMLEVLESDTGRRLSLALKDHVSGTDAVTAASQHRVEPSEVRFLKAQLTAHPNSR